MDTLRLRGHTDADGMLRLELPVGMADTEVEITLTISANVPKEMTHEEWLAFLEETAGSLSDDPIERGPQGEYEERESIE